MAYYNHNHAIVVEGITEDTVYINDPVSGREKKSFTSFDDSFTGLIFTFEPSENFQTDTAKIDFEVFQTFYSFLNQLEWNKFTKVALLSILITLCTTVFTWSSLQIIINNNS